MNRHALALVSAVLIAVLSSCSADTRNGGVRLADVDVPTVVVAHRGASWEAPENTLVAYQDAIAAGADWAECDVWLTKDRVPVLLHDETLKRTAGVDRPIGMVEYEELAALEVGAWKHERYRGEKIPTLEQALKLVKGKMGFVIEIKQKGMEQEVVEAIRRQAVAFEDVIIFAFDWDVMVAMGHTEPQLKRVWLWGERPKNPRASLRSAKRSGCAGIGLNHKKVSGALLRQVRAEGMQLFTWTVNEPSDMRRVRDLKVDGIISDRPALLRKILN